MSSEYPWEEDDLVNRRTLNEKMFPAGGIILWSGAAEEIPLGWALCDGQNGTPDLCDRFVVGAGRSYLVGATGGEDKHVLTTAEMPAHGHLANGSTSTSGAHTHEVQVSSDTSGPQRHRTATGFENSGPVFTQSAGGHEHTLNINVQSTGSGTAHENRPPYYALCYIMRL